MNSLMKIEGEWKVFLFAHIPPLFRALYVKYKLFSWNASAIFPSLIPKVFYSNSIFFLLFWQFFNKPNIFLVHIDLCNLISPSSSFIPQCNSYWFQRFFVGPDGFDGFYINMIVKNSLSHWDQNCVFILLVWFDGLVNFLVNFKYPLNCQSQFYSFH